LRRVGKCMRITEFAFIPGFLEDPSSFLEIIAETDDLWSPEVGLRTSDGIHVERLLFAGSSLDKARTLFATHAKRRPGARRSSGSDVAGCSKLKLIAKSPKRGGTLGAGSERAWGRWGGARRY
jgi:hypothetical protein